MSNLVWRLLLAKRSQKPDWKAALETTQGIYMITDKLNGKRYVGSAYGSNGIWSRWCDYVDSEGHGGNTGLINVIKRDGNYARMNFQFTMLEAINLKVEEDIVIRREQHWKTVLLTQKRNMATTSTRSLHMPNGTNG